MKMQLVWPAEGNTPEYPVVRIALVMELSLLPPFLVLCYAPDLSVSYGAL